MSRATRSGVSRRSFLRGAGAVGALAVGGSALSSCSSGGATGIRFSANKRETIAYFQKITDDFNKSQSTYKVRLENNDDTRVIADFVRGTPVEIGLANYNLKYGGYTSRGVLADLSTNPAAAQIRPDILEFSQQFGTYTNPDTGEKELNGLPFSLAAAGVIYNRRIFDKAGVSIPSTWSEFKEACETFKSKGITPIQGTFVDTWTIRQGIWDFVIGGTVDVGGFFTALNAQGTDIGPDSEVSFSKDLRAPMEQLLELRPYFNDDARLIAYDQGNRDFAAGKSAMMMQGPWAYAGVLGAAPEFAGGMFPLPCTEDPGDTKAWVNLDQIAYVPRASSGAKRDGALAVLAALMEPEAIHKYNADNLAFSPDIDAPDQSNPLVSDMNDYVLGGKVYQPAGYYVPSAIPLDQYVQTFLYSGEVESFLADLDRDWKRLAVRLSA